MEWIWMMDWMAAEGLTGGQKLSNNKQRIRPSEGTACLIKLPSSQNAMDSWHAVAFVRPQLLPSARPSIQHDTQDTAMR